MAVKRVRYIGPYLSVEVALGAAPRAIKQGETVDLQDNVADGLIASGQFEDADLTTPPSTVSPSTEDED